VQSALLEQKTVFTHSDGSELGDCDGYEQTSMSAAPVTSAVFTQHWACVSLVRQFVPLHLFDFLFVTAANGSGTRSLTVQVLVAVINVAPEQLNGLLSLHR